MYNMGKVTPTKVRGLGTIITGIGLITLSFYLVTYIQYYDDIGILEKKGDNSDGDDILTTADLPLGLLLQIEILGALILSLGGIFGIFGYRNKSTRSGLFIMSFLAFICYGGTGIYRTSILWGESEGNCKYFGDSDIHGTTGDYIKACPTTRHTNTRPTPSSGHWNITQSEPLFKSDCVFWFWDNTPTLETRLLEDSGSTRESMRLEMLENMNWMDKKNYGYMAVDSPCSNDLDATDCLADGRTVYEVIEKNQKDSNKYGIPINRELPGPDGNKQIPDITFCYYWGCSDVCNEYRYRINRVLHYGGLGAAFFSLLFVIMGASYSYGTPVGYNAGLSELPTVETKKPSKSKLQSQPWKPMNVASAPIKKRRLGDSRTLRF